MDCHEAQPRVGRSRNLRSRGIHGIDLLRLGRLRLILTGDRIQFLVLIDVVIDGSLRDFADGPPNNPSQQHHDRGAPQDRGGLISDGDADD